MINKATCVFKNKIQEKGSPTSNAMPHRFFNGPCLIYKRWELTTRGLAQEKSLVGWGWRWECSQFYCPDMPCGDVFFLP